MDIEQLHKTVNQLVESYHDRHRARGELTSFRSSNEPPQEPGEFPGLQALLDFHEEQRTYEDTLQSLQDELARIEKAYDQAEEALASVLPPNRMLHTTTTASARSSPALTLRSHSGRSKEDDTRRLSNSPDQRPSNSPPPGGFPCEK